MDSVIGLNKPRGITSQDAVTKVKRLLQVKKAGHAGTLDPLAEGVLLVCTGEATKITRFLVSWEKEYVATMKLGETRDTYDAEGRVLSTSDPGGIGRDQLHAVLERFRGTVQQLPPMYSAIKHEGVPLYRLARKGKEIERKPREVQINDIELLEFDNPVAVFRVVCSKGTYIRSIVHDAGTTLGVGAYMTGLIRTRVGRFTLGDSAGLSADELKKHAFTMDQALSEMTDVLLSEEAYRKARNGIPVLISEDNLLNNISSVYAGGEEFFRLKSPAGTLFAIGKKDGDKLLIERMLATKLKGNF